MSKLAASGDGARVGDNTEAISDNVAEYDDGVPSSRVLGDFARLLHLGAGPVPAEHASAGSHWGPEGCTPPSGGAAPRT